MNTPFMMLIKRQRPKTIKTRGAATVAGQDQVGDGLSGGARAQAIGEGEDDGEGAARRNP